MVVLGGTVEIGEVVGGADAVDEYGERVNGEEAKVDHWFSCNAERAVSLRSITLRGDTMVKDGDWIKRRQQNRKLETPSKTEIDY